MSIDTCRNLIKIRVFSRRLYIFLRICDSCGKQQPILSQSGSRYGMQLHVYKNGVLGKATIQSHNLPVDDLNIAVGIKHSYSINKCNN